jgi:hypothetical protein
MHKQPAYLYKNNQLLYANMAPVSTRFRKMYARPLKLYKGVDNEFTLQLLNNDQKRLNVVGQTLVWQMIDADTTELKLKKVVTVEGSDNANVQVKVSENDIAALKSGFYAYSVYLLNNGQQQILYGDAQYGASIPVEIIENSFPQIYPSVEITDFTISDPPNFQGNSLTSYSSAINARPDLNSNNSALHTAAFYSNDFDGEIDIEVTLEQSISGVTVWSVLETITLTSDQILTYVNFNGIFNWVRFRLKPSTTNTGNIDKILYRS